MAAAGKWLLIHFSLFSFATRTSAFNLDAENVLKKTGDRNSLFGFALAMHHQVTPRKELMLLVGAPKAKALSNQNANITGGLYKCPITSAERDCERVIFDNFANNDENKEDQWMGVSVASQKVGGKVLVCAHRYEQRRHRNTAIESRDVTGQCYILSEDLVFRDDQFDANVKICHGRLPSHKKFGICQQGVASTFGKDSDYAVYGVPGAYYWKGIVHVESRSTDFTNFDDGPYEVGDENKRDESKVPVPQNSYLGFSLDSGKGITNQDELTFVSGAPRDKHSGAVVFLKMVRQSNTLEAEHILKGEGLASSFGYDVAVVDLNKDGWNDIVVGAPQFFDKEAEIGGAVYVYINQKGDWSNITPIRLNGTKDSMFGLAVENIGDINKDGYEDIAVGAPFTEGGKVFIYHGSSSGINTRPVQVLEGKHLNAENFGYSLAGGMDLDENNYPDIAVGSLGDSVFIYRARPVIDVKKTVTILPQNIDFLKKNCNYGQAFCITVIACFQYTTYSNTYRPKITVNYKIEADTERRKSVRESRVAFVKNGQIQEYDQLSGSVALSEQTEKKCVTENLQLRENIKDKLHPISIAVGVSINQSNRKKRQTGNLQNLLPVLSQSEPEAAKVQFLKEGCGPDHICQSNLKLNYRFCSRIDNQDRCSPFPKENGAPVFKLSDQKDIVLEVTVTNKPSNVQNPKKDGDDAHEAQLIATFPETLTYSAFNMKINQDKKIICSANQNGSQATCDLGNPLKRGSKVTFYLILSIAGITPNSKHLEINLQLITTSEQANLTPVIAEARVVIELLLSVAGAANPSQIYFGGSVTGESAMKTEEDVGSLVQYEFRIINLGKSLKNLGVASLNIMWPKEINNKKWLLYLTKITSKNIENVVCSPTGEINSLKLKETTNQSRKKREINKAESDKTSIRPFSFFSEERKYKTLDCTKNSTARCVNISCPLKDLDSSAVLVLHSRLWNSTFLEEFSNLNYLDIIVKAMIIFQSEANVVVKNAETEVRVTVFPDQRVTQYFGVPWWIIFVAILLAILLLVLLMFLLWKCGFFKHSQFDDSVPQYHGVWIRKEKREPFEDKMNQKSDKKKWMTTWQENESYS
ncbi:LOW QUALITY PROTEIN: integrin alpha-6-like [Callorhinchus milii]|uniref:LOW QUALITY PROTEIN: integrin alpha-6-like n=1 Tax=Callorhinchus milii TaxID=7868 RepID=UPI001C3F7590|nr:LOW QUALITY PROTEIN: integrin alpha-6-like [Callorhinchus milii]